ncbi:MAG: UDP-N-acetylglucosamine 2-epimerase (non-hydrolyzing) [Candidatus Melainabacteria bacterium]|nr:UDP-N-acetylglucosamine 2-epimerase (non-hydrolyzing) [Candidatus Melainabacteria bacterium]
MKVLTVFGTRPEAIKMAPVVQALAQAPDWFDAMVCVTAQHRQMLDQVLRLFNITPDVDLDLMQPNQDLFQITTAVLNGMKQVLSTHQPDVVLVHGDTTTTLATSLAAFYLRIPVGHVEAGLRTYNRFNPFPEEINRVVTDNVASLFFAPTPESRDNLLKMAADPARVYLTGNTVIDALFYTLAQPSTAPLPVALNPERRLVLVTVHRRENFGRPLESICRALRQIVQQHPDVEMVLPVHPNPNVFKTVHAELGGLERLHLIEPLEYEPFCRLMAQATLILTDSGGIQEEGPSLEKPVLVLRHETERPEAVTMGTVRLVGSNEQTILEEVSRLLTDANAYTTMAHAANPYGDGQAAGRIVNALKQFSVALQSA